MIGLVAGADRSPTPTGLFNASLDAATRRAIDLREHDELDEQAFVSLVGEAVTLNRD